MNYYINILTALKSKIPFDISNEELICFSIDISRILDKKITLAINNYKSENNLKLTSIEKKQIRDFIIGKNSWKLYQYPEINKDNIIDDVCIKKALEILLKGIEINKDKVFGTLKSRLNKKRKNISNNIIKYKKIFASMEKEQNQLLIFHIKVNDIILSTLKSAILAEYNNLSNYHYIAIIFEKNNNCLKYWDIIADISIFCEFLKKEKKFNAFNRKKENKILELINFLKNNNNISFNNNIEKEVRNFYDSVSFGFQFNDLLIAKDCNTSILIMQKIELDETIYPCPDCMKTEVRGNSYPKLLQKSFECQNPNCPSRSKIGRGKRYDLLGIKRNLMLELNNKYDFISEDFIKKYRRDIFDDKNYIEMLIKFYSWNNSKVLIIKNFKDKNNKKHILHRKCLYKFLNSYRNINIPENSLNKLLHVIEENIVLPKTKTINKYITNNFSVYNGNSSEILSELKEQVTGAITSPPYYNAREYSQWSNLLCYLIDMMINAKSIVSKLENKSYYFYNIGDIVGQDNIFVTSHMSNRRLMLGFYSVLIFKLVGFNFIDNIIWDKGEVQSKRNSTENLYPFYIKPINCYEHILIFGKNIKSINIKNKILILNPVKKINSKGINILGHTAPYPEELVKVIFPFIDKKGYLLDPFLGSGTTIISSMQNSVKCIGIEQSNKYYNLAITRISKHLNKNCR